MMQLGRYRVLQKLGSGAMGEVLLARDDLLERDVALKTLAVQQAPDPRGRRPAEERFLMEARAVASLDHPNVVRLFDAGRAGGVPYLVMEAVSGPSLAAQLDRGLLAPADVRALGIQMARALEAAHACGIVHRDIKPTNILQSAPGAWKLADFGIARVPYSTLTETGHFLGTPAYAAPESLLRGLFTAASDIYGLGATLYEALCGTPPHGLAGGRTVLMRLREPIAHPAAIRGRAIPSELAAAIMAALSADPAARPDARALCEMLACSRPQGPAPRRRRLAASLAGAAVLVALLAHAGGDERAHDPARRLDAPAAADAGEAEMSFPPDPVGPRAVRERWSPRGARRPR